MAQQVKGKAAIVTGGGSGICFEFAKLLLEHGANVLIADLELRPESNALISDYQGENGPKAIFKRTDVSSWQDLEGMFTTAIQHFGIIDIVCPGAGVFEPPFSNFWVPPGTKPSVDDPIGDRYKIVDINLTHPIRVTQLAIEHFLSSSPPASSKNPKSIVHTCSVASQAAGLTFPLYIATKHGLDGFVRSMAGLEATHGIRVTAVEPGAVRTPLFTDHPEKMQMVNESKDNWIYPEEVARVMLALVQENEISNDSVFPRDRVFASGDTKITIRGGSILEVLVGNVRDVPLFGNQGPMASGAPGAATSGAEVAYKEVLQTLKPGWGTRHA